MTDTVLFVCPHGAAKSVLAAALFERLAAEHDLPLRAICAGTEPDAEVAPHVRALLEGEGLPLPCNQPQLVTEAMVEAAAWVISLGCTRSELPSTPHRWAQWDDVPPPSQALQGAYDCIQRHLTAWLAMPVADHSVVAPSNASIHEHTGTLREGDSQ